MSKRKAIEEDYYSEASENENMEENENVLFAESEGEDDIVAESHLIPLKKKSKHCNSNSASNSKVMSNKKQQQQNAGFTRRMDQKISNYKIKSNLESRCGKGSKSHSFTPPPPLDRGGGGGGGAKFF